MLTIFRYAAAVLLNCIAVLLLLGLLYEGFSFLVLLLAVTCLVLAHFAKPEPQGDNAGNEWRDMLDLAIDFPYRVVSPVLRRLRGESPDMD